MNNFFKSFGQIFVDMGKGFKFIFSDLPKKILGKENTEVKQQPQNEKADNKNDEEENINSVVLSKKKKTLSEKINEWYENTPSQVKKRQAYEASLKPFVLNPDGSDGIKSEEKVRYEYVARNPEGKIVKDYFAANSKLDVYSYLNDKKYIVYSIEKAKAGSFLNTNIGAVRKMSNKDLVFWLTQLATYIKAGIPLTDSVKVLAQQDKRAKYKSLYESIIYELTMGQTFSEALNKQGKAFPGLLVNMVKSAEMTGSIEETLDEMSTYYEEIEDTKRSVKSALAYPCIVLVFAIGIVIFMLAYIIPKFVEVYESMDAEIPTITQITLKISAFLRTKYYIIIAVVIVIVAGFYFGYKYLKSFRTVVQSLLMKMPVIGQLMISKEMSIFSRTFASLQKNNVLLTDSIDILAKITSNEVYKELELRTVQNLIKGNKMSETFKNHWAIPDIAFFMIQTGESTGELAEMLDKVADFYNKQQKTSIATIKTFIEPVMIISLAVIVGVLLIAILIPMFGIYSTIS